MLLIIVNFSVIPKGVGEWGDDGSAGCFS